MSAHRSSFKQASSKANSKGPTDYKGSGFEMTRATKFLTREIGPLTVGMLLRVHRNEQGLSQVELAKKLCVTVGFISNVENGRKKLSLRETMKIANKIEANDKHFALIWFEESHANNLSFKETIKSVKKCVILIMP